MTRSFPDAPELVEEREAVIEAFKDEWGEPPRTVTLDLWDDGDVHGEAFTTDGLEDGKALRRMATRVHGGNIVTGSYAVKTRRAVPECHDEEP